MKNIFRDPYTQGILFSVLSMGVTLVASIVLYPIYWKTLDKIEFVKWFSIFELSQFFLLMDIGFSQNFIRKYVNQTNEIIEQNFCKLRGTLFIVGFFAFLIQLPIFFWIANPKNFADSLPFFFLAISTTLTIFSYSETAALRLFVNFKSIYAISIASNLIFLIIVFWGSRFGVIAIAVACLIRSSIQYVGQIVILSKRIKIYTKLEFILEGSLTSFLMNSSYMWLFAADAFIFSRMGVNSVAVSLYMINRKLFDVVRGVLDAALNIISVKLANNLSKKFAKTVIFFIALIVTASYLISPIASDFLFGNGAFNANYSFALAFACLSACIFRFAQISLFMAAKNKEIFFLFIAVFLAKLIAITFLYFWNSKIEIFYLIQAVLVICLSFFYINILFFNPVKCIIAKNINN